MFNILSRGSDDYDTPPPVSGHIFKTTSMTRLSCNKPSLMIKDPNWWDYYVICIIMYNNVIEDLNSI